MDPWKLWGKKNCEMDREEKEMQSDSENGKVEDGEG